MILLLLSTFCDISYAGNIPSNVLNKIRESIEARYPDNYSMQKILIEDQVKSYSYLQSYKPPEIPNNVLKNIRSKIVPRYPYNFSMQKTLIEDQVKSYLQLNQKTSIRNIYEESSTKKYYKTPQALTDLQISLKSKPSGNGTVFYGETNLPDGTKLGIDLEKNEKFHGQDFNIFVSGGQFHSSPFTNHGNPLAGTYNVKLLTFFNKLWQKKDILTLLKNYDSINIIAGEHGWKKLEINQLITFPFEDRTSPQSFRGRHITGNTVRLRNPADDVVAIYKGPELKNTIIFFTNGTTVKILETGQGSYKIKVREYVGWVPEGVIAD